MITFTYPMEIGDPAGQRLEQIEALVDTGASFTVVPASVLRQLGVAPRRRIDFELGDGRTVQIDVGQPWVQVDGEGVIDVVAFGTEGVGPVLGAHTLEGLALAVDPIGRRLVPRRALLR